MVLSFLYSSYFTTIIAYCLVYLWNSLPSTDPTVDSLPWSKCENGASHWAASNCSDSSTNGSVPVTQLYFDNYVLSKSSGIEDFGEIQYPLLYAVMFTWICIFFFIFKGTRTIGKVVYVTAIVPYLILFSLAIRGCTLQGSYNI